MFIYHREKKPYAYPVSHRYCASPPPLLPCPPPLLPSLPLQLQLTIFFCQKLVYCVIILYNKHTHIAPDAGRRNYSPTTNLVKYFIYKYFNFLFCI